MKKLNKLFNIIFILFFLTLIEKVVASDNKCNYQGLEFSYDDRYSGISVEKFIEVYPSTVKKVSIKAMMTCYSPKVMYEFKNGDVYILDLDMRKFAQSDYYCTEQVNLAEWIKEHLNESMVHNARRIEERMFCKGQSSAFYCNISTEGEKTCEPNDIIENHRDMSFYNMKKQDYLFNDLLITD